MDYYQKYLKYKHKYNSTKHKPKQILTGGDIIKFDFFSLSKQIIMPNSNNYSYYIRVIFNNDIKITGLALIHNGYYQQQETLGKLNTQEVYKQIQQDIRSKFSTTDNYIYDKIIGAWRKE